MMTRENEKSILSTLDKRETERQLRQISRKRKEVIKEAKDLLAPYTKKLRDSRVFEVLEEFSSEKGLVAQKGAKKRPEPCFSFSVRNVYGLVSFEGVRTLFGFKLILDRISSTDFFTLGALGDKASAAEIAACYQSMLVENAYKDELPWFPFVQGSINFRWENDNYFAPNLELKVYYKQLRLSVRSREEQWSLEISDKSYTDFPRKMEKINEQAEKPPYVIEIPEEEWSRENLKAKIEEMYNAINSYMD